VTATAEQANEGNGYVRAAIAEMFGAQVAETVTVQYGGSMNAKMLTNWWLWNMLTVG
jgi:triosephosphate isomerase